MVLGQLNGVIMMNDVIEDIKKTISDRSVVIVATSGGPDSMCLLDLIVHNTDLKVICAHINHKLRAESDEEALMVKDYCTGNNITYEYYEINGYKGNTEDYARKKRYAFFEKLLKKHNSTYLLTAHHGDDLIETMLMRLLRGNIDNISGFSKITKRDGYYLYRPLIIKTKKNILDYCKKNNINYAVDQTNYSDNYTRNRIRKNILPYLKKENINVHLNFLKLSERLFESNNYIDKELNKKIKKLYVDNTLFLNKFNKEDFFIKEKIIYNILKSIYQEDIKLVKESHIFKIINVINSKKPNLQVALPKRKLFVKEYDIGKIIEKEEVNSFDYILENEIKLINGDIIKKIDDTLEKSNYIIKINSKDIVLPLHIRSKKNGDAIKLKNCGHRKVKDIFIGCKVPLMERKYYPILTDDNDTVLWIPGLKKSEFDKSKTENYDIIIKYFSERKF